MANTVADLIQRVAEGDLTYDEAEAEAERLGIGPLRRQPDPAAFDPMQEPFWSLTMAVAWISWRTKEAVREVWDDYRFACEDWHYEKYRSGPDTPVKAHVWIEARRPANLGWLALSEAYDKVHDSADPIQSVADAKKNLWRALQAGAISSSGISSASGIREPIAPVTWCDLHAFVDRYDRDYLMTDRTGLTGLRYDTLRFPSQQVLTVWPGELDKDAPILSTGAPGRPSSRHLVANELKRRAAEQQLEASLAAEAQYLADWLAVTYPDAPPMSQKSVKNALRHEYRALRKA
jgi:hypothetical protein